MLFGSYVKAHKYPMVKNYMTPRTHDCISIVPTGNLQVTQNVFCLNTVRVLKPSNIILVVAPDGIIKKVNQCFKYQKGEIINKIWIYLTGIRSYSIGKIINDYNIKA